MLITATLLASLAVTIVVISGREDGALVVDFASSRETVPCRVCRAASRRIHSRFRRTLADLPWSQGQTDGRVTRLKLVKRARYARGGLYLLPRCLHSGA
jgi:hypothetical protein